MAYPNFLRQPNWVIQSASADRPDDELISNMPNAEALNTWKLLEPAYLALKKGDSSLAPKLLEQAFAQAPNDILLYRAINSTQSNLLPCKKPRLRKAINSSRIAVVLTGELRKLEYNLPLLRALTHHADLFICTNSASLSRASLLPARRLRFIDVEPEKPMGAMQQWHKLALALSMVREEEILKGKRYTHIIKLRSDFYHVQPRNLLVDLVNADGLICSSDKVFGGRRELMLLFEGFYPAITACFDQQEQNYWPINVNQILRSDDCYKWYGMAFPRHLIGEPASVDDLRSLLKKGGESIAEKLLSWRPEIDADPNSLYYRLFQGHPRFASEVCFARFLNFNAIPANSCSSLIGFLRSDRLEP